MCTANYQASESNTDYAKSADGAAEIAVGANAISQAFQGYAKSYSSNAMLRAQEAAFLTTANAYDVKARDAIELGRDQNAWLGVKGRLEEGQARNKMSAAGVDINFGSAKTYLNNLKTINEIDRNNVRYNAMNAAFGYETQALNAKQRAQTAKASQTNPYLSALITGASSLYSGTQQLKQAQNTKG